jgi:hypothetical protein
MRASVALGFLVWSLVGGACSWEVSLGRGDGVSPFRFEEDVANPAREKKEQMLVTREVDLISEERAREYLESFGPDRIGSLRSVKLTVSEMRIDGVDLDRTGSPYVGLAGHALRGVPGESVELDDFEVDAVRKTLLEGEALRTTLSISLDTPAGTLDEAVPNLHIVLVVQPTLVIDATL